MLFMLLSSGATGLFLFHGLGLWSSVYGPKRGRYDATFGNDMSLLGNIVMIGSLIVMLLVPPLLAEAAPELIDPARWWIVLPPVAAAAAFYRVSLSAVGARLVARREQVMAIVEGRA